MKYIVINDIESTGLDHPGNGGLAEVIQLAAVSINYVTLKKAGEFNSMMNVTNPANLDTDNAQKALKVNGKSKEEILAAPPPEVVWKQFTTWMNPYGGGASKNRNRPVMGGANIINFDKHFIDDLCKRFGPYDKRGQKLFNRLVYFDTSHMFPWWFSSKELDSYSMDTLREEFGMSAEGAHDALKDAQDSAWIIARFLSYHRKLGTHKFKNAFAGRNPYA